jgi:SAM-dependent methyltransferase
MSTGSSPTYADEIRRQRAVWAAKPVLRTLYQRWFRRVVLGLSAHTPTIELGAGCGNFKDYHPSSIATDVVAAGPWIDRVVDAHHLDFDTASVGNLVAFDVLHHLQRPLDFLRQAERALCPGGRLVLCEPAVTPWSRFVYAFHHETLDPSWDLFGLDGVAPLPDPGHAFANMAIAHLLFRRHRALTSARVPGLRLISVRTSEALLYPLSGGFSYRCLLSRHGLSALCALEDAVTRPISSWLCSLRMLVILEKPGGAGP